MWVDDRSGAGCILVIESVARIDLNGEDECKVGKWLELNLINVGGDIKNQTGYVFDHLVVIYIFTLYTL